jgi:mannose-1-phosphate guanylyltransferase/mannose-6-phosphate isomerase
MMTPVILAGGDGVRLWPLSRRAWPKQFLALGGNGCSLLGKTLGRLEGLEGASPIVVCQEAHRFLAAEQLRQAGAEDATLLLEPEGRGTAPAVALAALLARQRGQGAPLLVLPSDHRLEDVTAFREALQTALPLAEAGHLVTFGVVPTRAETGYGYIAAGESLAGGHRVASFIEKPDATRAAALLAVGGHFWNSGIFLLPPDALLDELARLSPELLAACERALAGATRDLDFLRPAAEALRACPAASLDVAVMERTRRAVMVPLDAGWSDIGSWQALWEASPRDAEANALVGDVVCRASRGLLVHAASRLVATLGVEDLVIVETDDAVLVADRAHSQGLRALVADLEADGRDETRLASRVHRPWGHYQTVDAGPRHQVKHITVHPGARLSRQLHHHRAEHWVVVSGTARVTLDDATFLVEENASTFIPVGRVHCLENPGRIALELIEVQSGSYLGEDDIVRLDDRYGRD